MRYLNYKLTKRWLKSNRQRFKYKPYISERRKDSVSLKFEGVVPEIFFSWSQYGQGVCAYYQGKYYDFLVDFDIYERKTKNGEYYCSGCKEPRKLYSSREELYIDHCLEELLTWINKHFNENIWICFYGKDESCGGFGATLFHRSKLNFKNMKNKDFYFDWFPIVQ